MAARWRRDTLGSPRRSYKRLVIVALAAVILAVVIAQVAYDVVTSGRTVSRVAAQSYVAEVIPLVDQSTTLASTMHTLRSPDAPSNRLSLERALGDLVTGTVQDLGQLQNMGILPPNPSSGRLLQAALAARARGCADLAGAVELAIGPGPAASSRAVPLVVRAGAELMAGDRDYRLFVRALPDDSGPQRLPASNWVTDAASWSQAASATWVARLSSVPALQVHRSLVIIAVTVEPPVVRITGLPPTTTTLPPTTTTTSTTTTTTTTPGRGTTTTSTSTSTTTSTTTTTTTMQLPPAGSTSVLPPTSRLSVMLVAANAGNAAIADVWASAATVPQPTGAGAEGATSFRSVPVGTLQPGGSMVVTLPGLDVRSGDTYELWVAVGTGSRPAGPVTSTPNGIGQLDEVRIRVAPA